MTNVFAIVAILARKSGTSLEFDLYILGGFVLFFVVALIRNAIYENKLLQSEDADEINRYGCSSFPCVNVKWFKLACDLNDPVGYFNLGVCYREGRGVSCDPKRAFQLFRQAAELGDPDAAFWCGEMSAQNGDDDDAFEWFRRGQNGSYKCLLRLARAFEEGRGAPVNLQYAAILREEAKEMQETSSDDLDKLLERKITTKDGTRRYDHGSGKSQTYHTIYEDF